MSKAPSPETQVRTLKRLLKAAETDAREYRMQARIAEGRLTKSQQELADWKRRFDALLKVLPEKDTRHRPTISAARWIVA